MVFSSEVFLFAFLPLTYILYLICPKLKIKNLLLIAVSLLFYSYGEPIAVLLMIVSVIANYLFGRLTAIKNIKKKILIISIIFNVLMLFVFKYLTYTLSIFKSISGFDFVVPNIGLPIGISFFTFQAMSYVIDSYKKPELIRKNILDIFLYISFFPQLIAGPIIKFEDVAKQIACRINTPEKTLEGIRRFVCGLAKKVIVANAMGEIADAAFAFDSSKINICAAWIGALSYVLQIYFDFSGYSDMAIGLGKMFGFDFKENFNYPLASRGMTDFWRRWNISVSTWFKDYVYIPLGGNRKGKARTVINKIIVFLLTGIWHGANLTFVLWGVLHGLFLMFESYGIIPKKLFVKKIFSPLLHLYTLLVITLTFVIFRAESITQGIEYIKSMFCSFNFSAESGFAQITSMLSFYFIIVFIIGVITSIPIAPFIKSVMYNNKLNLIYNVGTAVGILILFIICIMTLTTSVYNPFIYFRF